MIRIQKSPMFDTRFVPHRQIWHKEDDACYECIDRTNYASVVVRLQRFSTTDMERRKKGIQKAVEGAIKHPSLCDIKEVLIDEENCITISISENARGINFQRFVDLCSSKPDYDAALQYILLTLLKLYQDLHASNLDLTSLPLTHVIISLKNNNVSMIESIRVRRPYLAKLDRNRGLSAPYNRFNGTYPAFVDLAAVAYYSFKKEDLFGCSDIAAAIGSLTDMQKLFFELLLDFQAPEFDAVRDVIQNMYNLEAIRPQTTTTEEQVIEDASAIKEGETETAIEKEEDEMKTAIGAEDDELKTAIGADEDETKTALEDEYDEVRTGIEDLDDEVKTAIAAEEDEIRTAIAAEDDELRTAIAAEDDELRTAIAAEEYDETHTAIEEIEDEVKTAIGDDVEFNPLQSIPQLSTIPDALSLLPASAPEIDDMFDAHSLISNESDFDVILSAETVTDEPQAIFTTKDYGFNGLTIKLYDNQCVYCEVAEQFITFDSAWIEIGSSKDRNALPTVDVLEQLVSNVRVMAALTAATTPAKKYLVNFVEEK